MPLTASTVSGSVAHDGIRVPFYDSVTPGEGSRPLILVHGTGGTTATHYGYLFPMIATRTRVIGVDWVAPAADVPLTVDALAAQVRAVIDEVLGEGVEFDLLGYSLGAVVAGVLASALGERVKSLLLVAGWARTDVNQRWRNDVWHHLYENDRSHLARFTAFCALSPSFAALLPPAALDRVAEDSSDDFTRRQMRLNADVDVTEQLTRIRARTLIVSADEDVMVPPHHQRQLLGIIDDARLTSVTSGHAIFLERPAELMQIADLFFREPDRFPTGIYIPETRS